MAFDWLGFGYAATILLGGFMGYKRKGGGELYLLVNTVMSAHIGVVSHSVILRKHAKLKLQLNLCTHM